MLKVIKGGGLLANLRRSVEVSVRARAVNEVNGIAEIPEEVLAHAWSWGRGG